MLTYQELKAYCRKHGYNLYTFIIHCTDKIMSSAKPTLYRIRSDKPYPREHGSKFTISFDTKTSDDTKQK